MKRTHELIETLSQEAGRVAVSCSPSYWLVRVLGLLVCYGAMMQLFMGLRSDIAVRLASPRYLTEILLLAAMVGSGTVACVIARYPDLYQQRKWMDLPTAGLGALALLLAYNGISPEGQGAVLQVPNDGAECALCIGGVALLPSVFLFLFLQKGATVTPLRAGGLAVLTSSAVGCLVLRLAERTDVWGHLLQGHYMPTVLYAIAGVFLGKVWLRW